MKINYWDCEYKNYEEYWDGENETRVYGCKHPLNQSYACLLNNKWGNDEDDCPYLDLKKEE